MSDSNRKKKKRKGKNKKKGNDSLPVGAASVESLQFKVDITSPEQVGSEGEGSHITDSVVLNSDMTAIHENDNHNSMDGRAAVETIDNRKEDEEENNFDSQLHSGDSTTIDEPRENCGISDERSYIVGDDLGEVGGLVGMKDEEDHLDLSLSEEPRTDTQVTVLSSNVDECSQRIPESSKVDTAVASTVEDFFNRYPDDCSSTQNEDIDQRLKLSKENEIIVDIQTSPWKIDRDVKEIVEHNTRTRMTKVVRTRKVIITKTEDGDEIETVVEEEDDDNPEVIGEIGVFDGTENETVEVQRVIKKRRVISGKTNDDLQYTEYRGEVEKEVPFEEATTITRKVMISKNEFDEDIETVIQEDTMPENKMKFDTVVVSATDDDAHDDDDVQHNDDSNRDNNDIDDDDHKPNSIMAEPGGEARCTPSNNEAEEGTSGDDTDVVVPIEIGTVESEVNLEDLLGPANEEHEAILEQQRADFDSVGSETSCQHVDYYENSVADKNISTSAEARDLVSEECREVVLDTDPKKNDSCDLSRLDMHESKRIMTSKVQFKLQLTEEQRHLLDEVPIPQGKNVLEDWVLVNFTSKEVMRFAELMRLKPGWLEDSVEMKHCCAMM